MTRYTFKCHTCQTTLSIETDLPDDQIHKVPPCPCGKSRMTRIISKEYSYGPWDA